MTQERHQQPEIPADPSGIEEPHDILAAEEFGIGTRDERFPADPTGIEEPHDILAAEEFAMPTPGASPPVTPPSSSPDLRAWLPLAVVAAMLAAVWLKRRR